jgi:hypothetical protein
LSEDSQDEDTETTTLKIPRRHNQSFEQIKQREDLMHQQQHARHNRFSKNRKGKAKKSPLKANSNHACSLEEWNQYQSCSSLKCADLQAWQTPKKGVVRNFIVSSYAEVDRISDIYVKNLPCTFQDQQGHDIKNSENSSWLQIRCFVRGFIIACFIVSLIQFKRE